MESSEEPGAIRAHWGVILVGPKHVGKSSAGRILARYLGVPFIDTDEELQAIAGATPRELYSRSPDLFRTAETAACRGIQETFGNAEPSRGKPWTCVVAAGGGLIDDPPALEALRAIGKIVLLELSAAGAWGRVAAAAERDGSFPPFLRGPAPELTHRELHERRLAAYRGIADLVIPADAGSPGQIANMIAFELRTFLTLPEAGLY